MSSLISTYWTRYWEVMSSNMFFSFMSDNLLDKYEDNVSNNTFISDSLDTFS